MGEVSYKLLQILIARQIKKEVDACIAGYKARAEALDNTDPKYTERLLSLSVSLSIECKQIAFNILSKYDKEIEGDNALQEYKRELSK